MEKRAANKTSSELLQMKDHSEEIEVPEHDGSDQEESKIVNDDRQSGDEE